MKIIDILNSGKPSLSFEVFPPKTSENLLSVEDAVREIGKLKPAFMSVTYGAGGGTSAYTLEIAKEIQAECGIPALAHITCISSNKATVKEQIANLKAAGINNIMALRGDIPEEKRYEDRSTWDYNYASTLVRELREANPNFCIGGACYPEVHPESPNRKTDIAHLKEKVDAGLDFLTTQMFFDNNLLYKFLYSVREAGITVPVVAGVMPITSARQVKTSIELSGCHMPQRFLSLVDKFGPDPDAIKQAGIIYATDQIVDLFANGINNVHVYTMNKPDVAAKIMDNLSDILGK